MTASTTTTTISDLAQLEAALKTDLLQTAGVPLLTLLQSLQTIAQNLAATPTPSLAQITIAGAQSAAAWVTFQAGILGSLPNLGAEAIGALISFGQTKITAALAPPPAAAAGASPAAKA